MQNGKRTWRFILSAACLLCAMSLSSCRELNNLRQAEQLQKNRIMELSQEVDRKSQEHYAGQVEKDKEIAGLQDELNRLRSYGFGDVGSSEEREQILISTIDQLEQRIATLQSSQVRDDRELINELEGLKLDNAELSNRFDAAQNALRKMTAKTYALLAEDDSPAALEQIAGSMGDALPAWSQLAETLRGVRQYRQAVRFLIARMIYNDGLVTVFAFGGIYAAGTFGFSFEEIMIFGIVMNVAAGLGAFAFGYLDDILGGKRTIAISLIGLIFASLLAVFAASKLLFWISGVIIGLLVGPNQAASRSLMARFSPPNKKNELFGFYAFSGKATAFIGPFLLGATTQVFGSQRVGMGVVAFLFILGSLLLLRVDEGAGIAAAERT